MKPKPKPRSTRGAATLPAKSTRGQSYDKRRRVIGVRNLLVGDQEEDDIHELSRELKDMMDVLLGREEPPVDTGISTLMEVAEAYHARAKEMEAMIHEWEREGVVAKGSSMYRFRTGQLRSFIELAKGSMDLGSRRVTALKTELEMEG